MKPELRPIHSTFQSLAGRYATYGGMEEVNRRLLAPYIRLWDGRILDVGCGAGNLIQKYIDPSRREVYTIDFSTNMIAETRNRLEHQVNKSLFIVNSLAQAIPFGRDSFDAAISVNTLHNLPSEDDIVQVMMEMARVVRPRGLILVEFRNARHIERKKISEHYDMPDLPQKVLSLRHVISTFKWMGFDIEKTIPLSGDKPGDGIVQASMDKVKRKFLVQSPDKSPRFAVIARKGPGFRTAEVDLHGIPVTRGILPE